LQAPVLVEQKELLFHLFLLKNVPSNLFIAQKGIIDSKSSNASNCMVLQFYMLFVIEKTDNSISYHASQLLLFLVGLFDTYLHA